MKQVDLYKGFEGEPEIIILSKDKKGDVVAELKLWIGFFDSIVELIKPNEKGFWEGVPLYYHTLTGWADGEVWECKEKELFVSQLEKIDINQLSKGTETAYRELLEIFVYSIAVGNRIYFVCD